MKLYASLLLLILANLFSKSHKILAHAGRLNNRFDSSSNNCDIKLFQYLRALIKDHASKCGEYSTWPPCRLRDTTSYEDSIEDSADSADFSIDFNLKPKTQQRDYLNDLKRCRHNLRLDSTHTNGRGSSSAPEQSKNVELNQDENAKRAKHFQETDNNNNNNNDMEEDNRSHYLSSEDNFELNKPTKASLCKDMVQKARTECLKSELMAAKLLELETKVKPPQIKRKNMPKHATEQIIRSESSLSSENEPELTEENISDVIKTNQSSAKVATNEGEDEERFRGLGDEEIKMKIRNDAEDLIMQQSAESWKNYKETLKSKRGLEQRTDKLHAAESKSAERNSIEFWKSKSNGMPATTTRAHKRPLRAANLHPLKDDYYTKSELYDAHDMTTEPITEYYMRADQIASRPRPAITAPKKKHIPSIFVDKIVRAKCEEDLRKQPEQPLRPGFKSLAKHLHRYFLENQEWKQAELNDLERRKLRNKFKDFLMANGHGLDNLESSNEDEEFTRILAHSAQT